MFVPTRRCPCWGPGSLVSRLLPAWLRCGNRAAPATDGVWAMRGGQHTTQCTGRCTAWICTQSISAALAGLGRVKRWAVCIGCVEPIHVSMEANVQRLESRYVSVHWASKGRVANTMSTNVKWMTAVVRGTAATPSAATTASVLKAVDWGQMARHVKILMSARSSMEDASKRVSTHRALITVSAAKDSACMPMVGPASP